MTHTLANAFGFLLDVVMPPRKTERLARSLTPETLHELAQGSASGGILPYHDPRVTALVWELKYRKNPHALSVAGEFLAEQALAAAEEWLGKAVLVPVPMHPSRRADRGYNQCELLCEAIMRHAGDSFGYAPRALERIRNTPAQQGLARYRRLKNIKGAMLARDEAAVAGRACIVIDDVRTTGATAAEAERALLEAGAESVLVLTLAQS